MLELLAVVAILIILIALVAPNLIITRRNLRQRELDDKAELVYIAAQNAMAKLRVSGNADKYQDAHLMTNLPRDFVAHYGPDGPVSVQLYYMIPGDSAATAVMTVETADRELVANSWVIEFDPASGSVFAVFYSETVNVPSGYQAEWSTYDALRVFDNRLHGTGSVRAANVGYYGGDIASIFNVSSIFQNMIEVYNEEKLYAVMHCVVPEGVDTSTLVFEYEISDASGSTVTDVIIPDRFTTSCYANLVLDDLSSAATRFSQKYSSLTPGTELTIRMRVVSSDARFEPSAWCSATTNSLFADESTPDTAYIAYGRHLQNLDKSSGVNSGIKNAIQTANILFADSGPERSWHRLYSTQYFNGLYNSTANFKPIENDNLVSYDGSFKAIPYRIANLNAQVKSGSAGLFAQVNVTAKSVALKNISLTGARVDNAAGPAAALVGSVKGASITGDAGEGAGGTLTVDTCRVYLDKSNREFESESGKDADNPRISGRDAGGLVGVVESGKVEIKNSLASTVIHSGAYKIVANTPAGTPEPAEEPVADGKDACGGLIGTAASAARVSISASYADSYLAGSNVGGLVGGGSVKNVENCYAAGFIKADAKTAAGLVNGGVGEMGNSYTIIAADEDAGEIKGNYYSTAQEIKKLASGVFYSLAASGRGANIDDTLMIGGMTCKGMLEKLSDAFQEDPGDTHAYNLRGQTLILYPYPRLAANIHYGDWQADFVPGSLVYYEIYQEGFQVGFEGKGVKSTLIPGGTLDGDGYGLVFAATEESIAEAKELRGSLNGGELVYLINPDITPFTAKGKTEKEGDTAPEYYVFPLVGSFVNPDLRNAKSFYQKLEVSNGDVFYYNPYLAAAFSSGEELKADDGLKVRSPRQLKGLSYYFETFARLQGEEIRNIFDQGRNIDYNTYNWSGYCNSEQIKNISDDGIKNRQGAIGGEEHAFAGRYNGGCYTITGVNFVTNKGNYVGLFGRNTGRLENIVVTADFDPEKSANAYYFQRTGEMTANDHVHMGVLAGQNNGVISNCAVAGYNVADSNTIIANTDSWVYVGGLVGSNNGSISGCFADNPEIRLSALYAHVGAGGLVGRNQTGGSISNSYALGYVNAAFAKDSDVSVSGFAGRNQGSISDSYCATALSGAGFDKTYAFAPEGGIVRGCSYLNEGSFTFVKRLYPFDFDVNEGGKVGDPTTYENMKSAAGSRTARQNRCYNHKMTTGNEAGQYPFRAVVRNAAGEYVHYGEWVLRAELGELGVFYWEMEDGGANSGCHFTYVGTEGTTALAGTTLCTAHDDGGSIQSFGYGWYARKDLYTSTMLKSSEGISVSIAPENNPGMADGSVILPESQLNGEVKTEMEKLLESYYFFPVTTRPKPTESEPAEGYDFVCLDAKGKADNTFGTWTLSDGEREYTYHIAPFFANAIQIDQIGGVAYDKPVLSKGTDGKLTDYHMPLGSGADEINKKEGNPLEIRAAEQLQYINWNENNLNCTTLIQTREYGGADNYTQFPYLMFAKNNSTVNLDNVGHPALANFHWLQTHDVDGTRVANFTPIAGSCVGSQTSSNSNGRLYAWFGSYYDGQSYKLQNYNIRSNDKTLFTVGLFGVTVGAHMKNIIVYSDQGNVISRSTPGAGTEKESTGYYAIGGLIAVAYDYYLRDGGTSDNTIENCAIAGYTIIDNSSNRQGRGHGSVGGLIGLSYVNLNRCSAVTDIEINCTHDNGGHVFGCYVHSGGLTGVAKYRVENCYAGGEIKVARQTIEEVYDKEGKPVTETYEALKNRPENNIFTTDRNKNPHIYVGGLSGGLYSLTYANFDGAEDGTPVFRNCYSYVKLPQMEGTIRGVSLIATVADRYGRLNASLTIENCYYLRSVRDALAYPGTRPAPYYFSNGAKKDHGLSEKEWESILLGDTYVNYYIINKDSTSVKVDVELYGVTSDQLMDGSVLTAGECVHNRYETEEFETCETRYNENKAGERSGTLEGLGDKEGKHILDALNQDNVWAWVDVKEPDTDVDVSGKYTFPGNHSELIGKNYPYPTVVTQEEPVFNKTVNVHYGEWPVDFYWEEGRAEMDIFSDLAVPESWNPGGENADVEVWAEKTFVLHDDTEGHKNLGGIGTGSITIDPLSEDEEGNPVSVAEIIDEDKSEVDNGKYSVTLRALREGTTRLRVQGSESTAEFVLNVTASGLSIKPDPQTLLLYTVYDNTPDTSAPGNLALTLTAGEEPTAPGTTQEEHDSYVRRNAYLAELARNGALTLTADIPDNFVSYEQRDNGDGASVPYSLARADKQAGDADNTVRFKVYSGVAGDQMLKANYTLDYHSNPVPETQPVGLVPSHTLGILGIADARVSGEDWNNVCAAYRSETGGKGGALAVVPTYFTTGGENREVRAPQPMDSAEFYLFGTHTDSLYSGNCGLAQLVIDSITVRSVDEPGKSNTFRGNDLVREGTEEFFTLGTAGSAARDDSELYDYRGFTLTGNGISGEVVVEVEAHYDVSTVNAAGETRTHTEKYQLALTLDSVPKGKARFEKGADDATGSVNPVGIRDDGRLRLPACTFERTGYSFLAWKLTAPENAKLDEASVELNERLGTTELIYADTGNVKIVPPPSETQEVVFTAVWEPVGYTVVYDGNGTETPGGEKSITDDTAHRIGEAFALASAEELGFRLATEDSGRVFAGWSTESDGSGKLYLAGEGNQVRIGTGTGDLKPSADGTITLYAQWKTTRTLYLLSKKFQGGEIQFTIFENLPSLGSDSESRYYADYWIDPENPSNPPSYTMQAEDGSTWTLEGWYNLKKDGKKVLNADGSICSVVTGYTKKDSTGALVFDPTNPPGTHKLYARWTLNAYVSAAENFKDGGSYILVEDAGDTLYAVAEPESFDGSNNGKYDPVRMTVFSGSLPDGTRIILPSVVDARCVWGAAKTSANNMYYLIIPHDDYGSIFGTTGINGIRYAIVYHRKNAVGDADKQWRFDTGENWLCARGLESAKKGLEWDESINNYKESDVKNRIIPYILSSLSFFENDTQP